MQVRAPHISASSMKPLFSAQPSLVNRKASNNVTRLSNDSCLVCFFIQFMSVRDQQAHVRGNGWLWDRTHNLPKFRPRKRLTKKRHYLAREHHLQRDGGLHLDRHLLVLLQQALDRQPEGLTENILQSKDPFVRSPHRTTALAPKLLK